jgi:hypothetical protein
MMAPQPAGPSLFGLGQAQPKDLGRFAQYNGHFFHANQSFQDLRRRGAAGAPDCTPETDAATGRQRTFTNGNTLRFYGQIGK